MKKLTGKDVKKLVKATGEAKFAGQGKEYSRAVHWRVVFAERGFKLTNKLIPDSFVNNQGA